ncbi:hypothetical protein RB595_006768 [Gaeumannomyces hyphopodioides]
MRSNDVLKGEEAVGAGQAAARGAAYGAARWGVGFAILGAVGYFVSPIYRGLTIQFKTYVQMSGMVFGGMIEADHQLRVYEANMRLRRKEMRSQMARAAYERELRELEGGRPLEPQDDGGPARPKR